MWYDIVDSSLVPVDYGVRQGRITALILLILFIKNVFTSNPDTDFVLFAKDTKLLISDLCVNLVTHRTNMVLMKVRKWLLSNILTLNAPKNLLHCNSS